MKVRASCFALLLVTVLGACGAESVTGPEAAAPASAPEAPRMSGGTFAGSGG